MNETKTNGKDANKLNRSTLLVSTVFAAQLFKNIQSYNYDYDLFLPFFGTPK